MWSHSLLSQSVYCGAAGLNCKERSVRDIAWVCVCVRRLVCELQPLRAKGDWGRLCHSCRTLWTRCRRPTCPSVCPGLYIPAWMCSFWLVSLRYDTPSGVSMCVYACVYGCVQVCVPMEPWHCAIYQVCCWLCQLAWTELRQDTKSPSLPTTSLSADTNIAPCRHLWQIAANLTKKVTISQYGIVVHLTNESKTDRNTKKKG